VSSPVVIIAIANRNDEKSIGFDLMLIPLQEVNDSPTPSRFFMSMLKLNAEHDIPTTLR
jgi:hypothetical protein